MTHAADEGAELNRYREYLALLARLQIEPRFQGKIDLSGVVQQTLLEAYKEWPRLAGLPQTQLEAWLRKALANNLTDEVRKLGTAARDLNLERSLEASSSRLEAWLEADQESPSQNAQRNEELLLLAEGLSGLPEDQRCAVELHHLKGLPVAEVAVLLNRTPGAIGALLVRAMKKLRGLLRDG